MSLFQTVSAYTQYYDYLVEKYLPNSDDRPTRAAYGELLNELESHITELMVKVLQLDDDQEGTQTFYDGLKVLAILYGNVLERQSEESHTEPIVMAENDAEVADEQVSQSNTNGGTELYNQYDTPSSAAFLTPYSAVGHYPGFSTQLNGQYGSTTVALLNSQYQQFRGMGSGYSGIPAAQPSNGQYPGPQAHYIQQSPPPGQYSSQLASAQYAGNLAPGPMPSSAAQYNGNLSQASQGVSQYPNSTGQQTNPQYMAQGFSTAQQYQQQAQYPYLIDFNNMIVRDIN